MYENILIYGANGYTAELIADLARKDGAKPILAGRSPDKIRPLAEKSGFAHRAFSLDDPASIDKGLEGVVAVLNCAGPFSRTAKPSVASFASMSMRLRSVWNTNRGDHSTELAEWMWRTTAFGS